MLPGSRGSGGARHGHCPLARALLHARRGQHRVSARRAPYRLGRRGGRASQSPAALGPPPALPERLMARVSFDVMDFAAAAGAPLAGRLRAFSCSCARTGPPLSLAF